MLIIGLPYIQCSQQRLLASVGCHLSHLAAAHYRYLSSFCGSWSNEMLVSGVFLLQKLNMLRFSYSKDVDCIHWMYKKQFILDSKNGGQQHTTYLQQVEVSQSNMRIGLSNSLAPCIQNKYLLVP